MLSHLVRGNLLLEWLACLLGNRLRLVHILLTESSAMHASVLPRAQREPLLRGPLEMHLEEGQQYLLKLSAIMKVF